MSWVFINSYISLGAVYSDLCMKRDQVPLGWGERKRIFKIRPHKPTPCVYFAGIRVCLSGKVHFSYEAGGGAASAGYVCAEEGLYLGAQQVAHCVL